MVKVQFKVVNISHPLIARDLEPQYTGMSVDSDALSDPR